MTVKQGELILASDINNLAFFPKGTILVYNGSGWTDNQTLIGWYRCDAQNKAAGRTPDLTDRFIMGSAAAEHRTGGQNTQQLTADNMPAHTHTVSNLGNVQNSLGTYTTSWFQTAYNKLGAGNSSNVVVSTRIGKSDGGWGDDTTVQNTLKLKHTHDILTKLKDNALGQAFDNRPQYYKVIYIKKVV